VPSPPSKGVGRGEVESVGALSMEVGVEPEDVLVDAEGLLAMSVSAGAGMLLASTRRYIAGSGACRSSNMMSPRAKPPVIFCARDTRAPASAACMEPHRDISTRRDKASVWTSVKRVL